MDIAVIVSLLLMLYVTLTEDSKDNAGKTDSADKTTDKTTDKKA